MKLWLDDTRPAPDPSWLHAFNAEQAIAVIKETLANGERFDEAELDYNLGACPRCEECNGWRDPCGCRCHWTGYTVVTWMEIEDRWPAQRPRCHSEHPIGKAKIEAAIARKFGDPPRR